MHCRQTREDNYFQGIGVGCKVLEIKLSSIFIEKNLRKTLKNLLTLQLPWMTKMEFLITMLIQYKADKWWEKEKYQLGDY